MSAPLRPSGAARWINCPMSVRLEKYFIDEETSLAAREGTAAHLEAERYIKKQILGEKLTARKKAQKADLEEFQNPAFDNYVERYCAYVHRAYNEALASSPESLIFSELMLDLSFVAPELSGTADVVIYDAGAKRVDIIDLKFGRGEVVAEDNPQLQLYAAGAIHALQAQGLAVESYTATIYQPKLDAITTIEGTPGSLAMFIDRAVMAAERTKDIKAEGLAGNHCAYCKARHMCAIRASTVLERFQRSPKDSNLIHADDLPALLDMAKAVSKWVVDIENRAKDLLSQGVEVKGWKYEQDQGQRRVTDVTALIDLAEFYGVQRDDVIEIKPRDIKTIEAALGKETAAAVFEKGPGSRKLKKVNKNISYLRASSYEDMQKYEEMINNGTN